MTNTVYITRIAAYLPGEPVTNGEMEEYLGYVSGKPSKSKSIVLRNNGITSRYYAIDKAGNLLETNAAMTARAVKTLMGSDLTADAIQMLASGTTSPDQLLPGHANMVHGLIGGRNMEVSGNTGSCLSGFHAFKSAWLHIAAGIHQNAVVTGSELWSKNFRHEYFEEEAQKLQELENQPYIAFDRDFLRWMLSDGAAAALLSDKPGPELSLRVDWIESRSFAHELETCMYMGAEKDHETGNLKGFREYTGKEWLSESIFAIKQDTKLLGRYIISKGLEYTREMVQKYGLKAEDIDWVLPHISSMFFHEKMQTGYSEIGFPVPAEKWYTNLTRVGNLGSAAFLFIIEEMWRTGMLRKGQRLLVMVPESARFAYGYAHLTVV